MKRGEKNRKPDSRSRDGQDAGRGRRDRAGSPFSPAWQPEVLLVAEASPFFQELALDLQGKGCQVYLGPVGPGHLEELVRQRQPDLVLLDLGSGAAQRIGAVEAILRLHPRPKVMVLGRRGVPLPPAAFSLEVDEYLFLPASPAAVERLAARCLGRPTPRSRLGAEKLTAALNFRALWSIQRWAAETRKRLTTLAADLRHLADEAEGAGEPPRRDCLAALSATVEELLSLAEEFLSRRSRFKRAAAASPRSAEGLGTVIDLPLSRVISCTS